MLATDQQVSAAVDAAVRETPITDVHTHLFAPCFGGLLLWGIDELLVYHYLVAETFRRLQMPYDRFWQMTRQQQAELIWRTMFIEHSPIGESARGVLTVLKRLGLDVASRNLDAYREHFAKLNVREYVGRVFRLSGVREVVMTNDPFDDAERAVWLEGCRPDRRFRAALRIDALLNDWPRACRRLKQWGYDVQPGIGNRTEAEVQRFLSDWIDRMDALYLAASLPPDFSVPEDSDRTRLLTECVLPVCRKLNKPFAMMIGAKKQVNPGLRLAGDSVGKASIETVERLCAAFPSHKFLVTMLARENQHELCVAARKYRNLMIFGCWWFLNVPSLVDEITRMRIELLGTSVVLQHSDARVLDQLIYKWDHSRTVIGRVLREKYRDLLATGWQPTEEEIRRDVDNMLGGAFREFLNRRFD